MESTPPLSLRATLVTAVPAAAAIGVFGALYGAAARPLLGPGLTLLSSLIVFSGSLQFASIALVAAGAGPAALILTALVLDLRHVVMGAVIRPWLGASVARRVALAFLMVDETFGFTVAAAHRATAGDERTRAAEGTLLVTGVLCYGTWQLGTLLGVLGAGIPGMEGFAGAVFPVLFIGLTALAARGRSMAVRAAAAAVITAVICFTLPDVRALAPVVAGLAVAIPEGRT
jgi:predicted branched-subunit amino acid permease